MNKFLYYYTILIILTIVSTTANTFLLDNLSIEKWIYYLLFFCFLWLFVYIVDKEQL